MVKYANVFFVHSIQQLGGVETYLWEIAKKYHEYDIVVAYQEADGKQLARLRKLVRCIRVNKPIYCKRCFHAYEFDMNLVVADEYIQCIHANYEIQGLPPNISPKITKYVAVSKWVAEAYQRLLEQRDIHKKVEIAYNPISVDKPNKVLKLISPTRLSKEKGKDRMIQLAEAMLRKGIEYCKYLQDNGKLERGYAISWELYRVLNGYDPNYMLINDNNYLVIDDETIDVDTPEQIELVNNGLR